MNLLRIWLVVLLVAGYYASAQDVPWEKFDLTAKYLPKFPPVPEKSRSGQGWGMSMQWQTGGTFNTPDDGFLLGGGFPELVKTYFDQHPDNMMTWTEYLEGLWGVEPNDAAVSTSGGHLWNLGRISLEMPPFIAIHLAGGAGREQTANGKVRARVFPFESPSDFFLIEMPVSYRLKSYAIQVGAELRPGTSRIQAVLGGGYHFQRTVTRGDLQLGYQVLGESILLKRSANIHGGFIDAGLRVYLYEGFFLQPVFSTLILSYNGDQSFLSPADKSPEVKLAVKVGIGYHVGKRK